MLCLVFLPGGAQLIALFMLAGIGALVHMARMPLIERNGNLMTLQGKLVEAFCFGRLLYAEIHATGAVQLFPRDGRGRVENLDASSQQAFDLRDAVTDASITDALAVAAPEIMWVNQASIGIMVLLAIYDSLVKLVSLIRCAREARETLKEVDGQLIYVCTEKQEAAAIARENKMRHVVVAAQAAAKWRSRNKVAPGVTMSAVQAPATTKPQTPKKSRLGLRMAALTNRTDSHDVNPVAEPKAPIAAPATDDIPHVRVQLFVSPSGEVVASRPNQMSGRALKKRMGLRVAALTNSTDGAPQSKKQARAAKRAARKEAKEERANARALEGIRKAEEKRKLRAEWKASKKDQWSKSSKRDILAGSTDDATSGSKTKSKRRRFVPGRRSKEASRQAAPIVTETDVEEDKPSVEGLAGVEDKASANGDDNIVDNIDAMKVENIEDADV